MKKLLSLLLSVFGLIFISFTSATSAQNSNSINLEYFGRDKCGHCEDLKQFLEKIKPQYPNLTVTYYDLADKENQELFDKVTTKANLSKITPIIFIGNTFIEGFRSDATTGERILKIINTSSSNLKNDIKTYLKQDNINDNVETVAGGSCSVKVDQCAVVKVDTCKTVEKDATFIYDLPFIGTVNLKNLSLPFMSMILGFIDGFNPCAMWVLVMFMTFLTQAGNKTRMMQMAGAFMVAEAIMYYLILNVWMTTWNFVGLDNIVTPIVGVVAIGGGIFFLWEWKTSDGTCKVTSHEQRRKTSAKVKELVQSPMTWATLIGIIGLALSVNIVEFACSIGIPQAFTKILDLNPMIWIVKQWYMFLYILFYMLDDVIVFGICIYSFEKLGIMTKYSKIANLVGGILMLIIGAIMLTKPELLIF